MYYYYCTQTDLQAVQRHGLPVFYYIIYYYALAVSSWRQSNPVIKSVRRRVINSGCILIINYN